MTLDSPSVSCRDSAYLNTSLSRPFPLTQFPLHATRLLAIRPTLPLFRRPRRRIPVSTVSPSVHDSCYQAQQLLAHLLTHPVCSRMVCSLGSDFNRVPPLSARTPVTSPRKYQPPLALCLICLGSPSSCASNGALLLT